MDDQHAAVGSVEETNNNANAEVVVVVAEQEERQAALPQPVAQPQQQASQGEQQHNVVAPVQQQQQMLSNNNNNNNNSNHQQQYLLRQLAPASSQQVSMRYSSHSYNNSTTTSQQQRQLQQQSAARQGVAAHALGHLELRGNNNNNNLAMVSSHNNLMAINNSNNNLLGLSPTHNNNNNINLGLNNDGSWLVPERSDLDEESYMPSLVSGWSIVERSQESAPSARSLHASALCNGVWYIFGGYDGNQRVNTFDAFSFSEKRWTPVLPSGTSGPPPSPRDRHVAVAYNNTFYVHGGFDGTARVSDFWSFDFSTMTWREVVALQGRPPSPRHSHAAVVHNSSMFIFGGYDGSYKSDLHEFDFGTLRWSVVPAAGRRPRARYRATCVVHRNNMIMYGGHDGTRHLSDTHVLDLDNRVWTSLVTEGTLPTPRDSHVCVWHGHAMYVFGGSSGSAMNDLHELSFASNDSGIVVPQWRAVPSAVGADQPRHRFCHVATVYQDSMFVFGGYDGSDRLNDLCRFDFAQYDMSFDVPPSTLVSDLKAMLNDPTLSDVTFIVEGRESEPIYAHKLILVRCPYFESLFLGQMRESRMDSIRIAQVSHSIFLSVLEYLYTDQTRITYTNAMEMFEAADLFCVPRLKVMCEKRMLQSITVENAAAIFHAADMHSATALRQKSKKYILGHFEDVSKTSSFEEMGRSNIELVFELLRSR